jgi:hypothetical protein
MLLHKLKFVSTKTNYFFHKMSRNEFFSHLIYKTQYLITYLFQTYSVFPMSDKNYSKTEIIFKPTQTMTILKDENVVSYSEPDPSQNEINISKNLSNNLLFHFFIGLSVIIIVIISLAFFVNSKRRSKRYC